jgi:hypothetical protein
MTSTHYTPGRRERHPMTSPATHVGYELVGAGMLIAAGGGRGLPMDYDELERWTRVGYERGMKVTARGAVTKSAAMPPAQGKGRPHAIAWGLWSVAASCKELERSPQELRPTAFVCLMRLVKQLRWPRHMRGSRPHSGERLRGNRRWGR